MKFFNIDLHTSVIEDLKFTFDKLGHKIESCSLSDHNWIFNRNCSETKVINKNNWNTLDKELCNHFFDEYKNALLEYDGFICTYPPSFSLLYERFNKPILLHIPIRYEVPFSNNTKSWNGFNLFLQRGIDVGKIIPVANSLYDKEYFEYFVKRECKLIPSICSYTNTQWKPTKNKFLYSGRLAIDLQDIMENKLSLGKYDWSKLSSYKGIVIIPYNCSTMSIFEHYTANIPLFCPSIDFMMELYKQHGEHVLSELSWNKLKGIAPGSKIGCQPDSDPNRYDNADIMKKWIELSDFYNKEWMPYITYFKSFDDLKVKLVSIDLQEVSNNMKKFNILRKTKIHEKWSDVLNAL